MEQRTETNPTQAAVRACYAAAAGAGIGLGCADPLGFAQLRPGETVLDLGCGGGMDCLRAAEAVGPRGCVIGVDMTPEMLSLARATLLQAGLANVEFRLGGIEQLPIADETIDVIISNCVINLTSDKERVFAEAFRVLGPGGRVCIADVLATRPIPQKFLGDQGMVCGCMGGAAAPGELRGWLGGIGFADIRIEIIEQSRALISEWAPGTGIEDYVASAMIQAQKPD